MSQSEAKRIATNGVWVQFGLKRAEDEYAVKTLGWFNLMRVVGGELKLSEFDEGADTVVCFINNAIIPLVFEERVSICERRKKDKHNEYYDTLCKWTTDPVECAVLLSKVGSQKLYETNKCWACYKIDDIKEALAYYKMSESKLRKKGIIVHSNCADMNYGDGCFIGNMDNTDWESPLTAIRSPCLDSNNKYYFIPIVGGAPLSPDVICPILQIIGLPRELCNIIAEYMHNFAWVQKYKEWQRIQRK